MSDGIGALDVERLGLLGAMPNKVLDNILGYTVHRGVSSSALATTGGAVLTSVIRYFT